MLFPFPRLKEGESQMIYNGSPEGVLSTDDQRVAQFVRGEAGERLMEMERSGHMERRSEDQPPGPEAALDVTKTAKRGWFRRRD
jgi:hypothetical protein